MTSGSSRNSNQSHGAADPDEVVLKSMGPTEIDAQLQHLDDQVLQIQSQKTALKRRRNALSPAVRLPPELLLRIFGYCITPLTASDARPVCFAVSHVCHHWRAVALDAAVLWNTFAARRHDMAREMVARSKAAPLFVRIYLDGCELSREAEESGGSEPDLANSQAEGSDSDSDADGPDPASDDSASTSDDPGSESSDPSSESDSSGSESEDSDSDSDHDATSPPAHLRGPSRSGNSMKPDPAVACLHSVLGNEVTENHIQHLELSFSSAWEELKCYRASASLLALETLIVAGVRRAGISYNDIRPIFDSPLPNLKALDLNCVVRAPALSPFPKLRSLHLSRTIQNINTTLQMLGSLIDLEDLHLEYACVPPFASSPVTLPCLKHFSVDDDPIVVCHLLDHIAVPQATAEDIKYGYPTDGGAEQTARRVGMALAGHFSSAPRFSRLSIEERADSDAARTKCLFLRLWTAEPVIDRPRMELCVDHWSRIPFLLCPSEGPGWANDVTVLEISGFPRVTHITWTAVSRCIPLVKTLILDLTSKTAKSLLIAMDDEYGNSHRLFEALHMLTIRQPGPGPRGARKAAFRGSLVQSVLDKRRAAGAPVQILRLIACSSIVEDIGDDVAVVIEETKETESSHRSWKPYGCDNRPPPEPDSESDDY